jgi:hypothetical protein
MSAAMADSCPAGTGDSSYDVTFEVFDLADLDLNHAVNGLDLAQLLGQ